MKDATEARDANNRSAIGRLKKVRSIFLRAALLRPSFEFTRTITIYSRFRNGLSIYLQPRRNIIYLLP